MTPVELVCFHHAGGGAASFHRLRRALGAISTAVVPTALKLPGRDLRRDEPRCVDADACVQALADELDGLLSRPHVLLGHNMSALLANSLANNVFRADCGHRRRSSSHPGTPHLPGPLRDLHLIDDRELAVERADQGGCPPRSCPVPNGLH